MVQGEQSMELVLSGKTGHGSMAFLPLFPNITLAYISIQSEVWPAPDMEEDNEEGKGPFIINYCVGGRCEMLLSNDTYVYVTDRQLALSEQYAQKQYRYPRRFYEGMELFVDTGGERSGLAETFGMDLGELARKFCPEGNTYIAGAGPEIEDLFQRLWEFRNRRDEYAIWQMKTLVLAILGELAHGESKGPGEKNTFYTESQVAIAKEAEAIMTADLRQHHPARELAAQFSVSETSLKNYFRGVFGQNVSDYMRQVRVERAQALLGETSMTVAAIAEAVGYLNQSKFAAVFKKECGVSPLEYRRRKGLEGLR